jgi:chromosome segregation ATPase
VNASMNGMPDDSQVQGLQRDIQQTREEIAATVAALSAKADIKARARDRITDASERVSAVAADTSQRVGAVAADARQRLASAANVASDRVRTLQPADVRPAVSRVTSDERYRTSVLAAVAAAVALIVLVRWRRH